MYEGGTVGHVPFRILFAILKASCISYQTQTNVNVHANRFYHTQRLEQFYCFEVIKYVATIHRSVSDNSVLHRK